MVRKLILGLTLYGTLTAVNASAQEVCSPNPPAGAHDSYYTTTSTFPLVEVGLSEIQFYTNLTADASTPFNITASLDRCSDPDFSFLGVQCETVEGGYRSCKAWVMFAPLTSGLKRATFYGVLSISTPTQSVNELQTILLYGFATAPLRDLAAVNVALADGVESVRPNRPLNLNVTVSGTNIEPNDSLLAPIVVTIGNRTFGYGTIPISELISGPKTVSIRGSFTNAEVGIQTVTARIGDGNIEESTYSNNFASTDIRVRRNCKVDPLTPVTDPIAKVFDDANGDMVDTEHLAPGVEAGRVCLMNRLTQLGQDPVTTSGYRPEAYQLHLREVWLKAEVLEPNTDPDCREIRLAVLNEKEKHKLVRRPVMQSKHSTLPGTAFDLTWGRIVDNKRTRPTNVGRGNTIDSIARQCGLFRPEPLPPPIGDPVHFVQR